MSPTAASIEAAIALHQAGRLREAEAIYLQLLAQSPDDVNAWHLSGLVAYQTGRPAEAVARIRRAIELYPQFVEAHNNLGAALTSLGARDEAAGAFAEALRLDPANVRAMLGLAELREMQARYDEALGWCDAALRVDSTHAQAHLQRAYVCRAAQRTAVAIDEFREVQRLQPDNFEAYNGLAVLYLDQGCMDEAIACCRAGLERAPRESALHANLSTAMQNLGRQDEAISFARESVRLNPANATAHSNLLYRLNFHPAYDAASIFAEHLRWGQLHADPLTEQAAPHANVRDPERRLRLGYVSPYFRDHAVNFFTRPILESHDHAQFEVYCYSDATPEDAVTALLRNAADHWRETRTLNDAQLAQRVRDDAIDVLVDLTGHIHGSRLLAFARKPAPVQVTYIGYQNTTGMRAMDYRLTDERADPPGLTDRYYTETLVRLPRAYFCYRPPDEAPNVSPLPAASREIITFGSFNNFSKIGPNVLDAWFKILARVPGSRLIVLAPASTMLNQQLAGRARACGIEDNRVELCAKRPRRQYLELLAAVDIALDPFPFNGHTTTCDAVWMGVPVVMLEGSTYASRFGTSVLANVGLEPLIAHSTASYVDTAVSWSAPERRGELAQLRRELRPRMAASPLLDFGGFTRNLERAFREMWRTWCAKHE